MKSRWPLSRKILLIALANLLLFGLVVAAFMLAQFQFGPESLLLGPAQDRILAIGNAFSVELNGLPESKILALFRSYRTRYEADFYLINPEGGPVAGPPVDLPPAVIERLRHNRPPGGPRNPPPPRDGRKRGPPPPRKDRGKQDPPPGPPPEERKERPPPPPEQRPPNPEAVFLVITSNPTAYWAGARIPITLPDTSPGAPAILLIRSTSVFNNHLFFDPRLGLGLAAGLMLVSALCWLPFIRGLTRSIAEMDRATQQIAEGRFNTVVANSRSDELGHLGGQINRLASRLASFVKNQKRFLGDIAHELCAPIARVQFALGILEQKAEEGQRHHVQVLHEEIQEMSGLVNELLSFSKAGLHPESVPLSAVDIAGAVHRAVAREGGLVEVNVPEGLMARANEAFLVRAIGNVLRNAVRYAADAGPIAIKATRLADRVEIVIADSGPGLPESELHKIFTAFYRPEEARTRETGGTGLGLAIVQTCVSACGGTVIARNRAPHGLEVVIHLVA